MTMIDVDTSPLQAAREWRGIGIVAAAVNSGLPLAQAEALEEGNPGEFGSIDEMIAAAVLYGASIGIGRDEAMALLDRTVCRVGAQVQLPDHEERPNEAFSGAVQERSARIAERTEGESTPPLLTAALTSQELQAHPVLDPWVVDEPGEPEAALLEVPAGPTPEQAVAASGELHLDSSFSPDAPWERGGTGELEAWVGDYEDDFGPVGVASRRPDGPGVASRLGATMHAALERVVGTDRADAVADRTRDFAARAGDLARDGRERLRRSEHATLFVAIGAGAILIALVVALGGALGGSDEPVGPGPAQRAEAAAAKADAKAPAKEEAAAAATATKPAPKAIIPPARLTLDIYNAGSRKGYAKEVAAKLEPAGYKIGEVTNAKTEYAGATIIHPADMVREAKLLARRTGITTLQVAPGSTRRITIVVT